MFTSVLGLECENLDSITYLDTPMRDINEVSMVYKELYDIILGVNWLSKYKAMVDYYNKRVTLLSRHGTNFVYQTSMNSL